MGNSSEYNQNPGEPGSFEKIIQTAPIGLLSFSADWEIQFVNNNFLQFAILYKLDSNALIGTNILSRRIFPETDLTEELKRLKEGQAFEKEIKNVKTFDGKISVFLKGAPLFDGDQFAGGVLIIEDLRISSRSTETELTAADYEKAIGKLNDLFFITDKEGLVKHSSGRMSNKLEFNFNETKDYNVTENLTVQSSIEFSEKLNTAKNRRASQRLNVTLTFENESRYFDCGIEPIVNRRGQTDYFLISFNDISAFIKKEEELNKQLLILKEYEKTAKVFEEHLQTILSETDISICVTDLNGTILYANQRFTEVLEVPLDEIENRNIKEFIRPDYTIKTLFNLKDKQITNIPFVSKTGKESLLSSHITPVYDGNNNLKKINYFFIDINSQKYSEEEFNLLNSIFESYFDGIILESEGKIVKANNSLAQMFGYEKSEDLIGEEFINLSSNSDGLKTAEYLQMIQQRKNSFSKFDFLARKKDGSNFFAEVSTSLFDANSKFYSVMILRDITESKRAQQQIRESEEKYRNIIENIDDFLYTFERVGHLLKPVFYTSSVKKVTGYNYQEFLTDRKLYLKIIHPDDSPLVKKVLKRALRSRMVNSEEFELRILNKNGNIVWIRNKINIVRNPDGTIKKLYGLASDISLKKIAEKDLIESTESLVKINETKDKFISIVSHDLRTPFSSILGFTDLLLNDEGLSEDDKKQYVKYIRESSQSMLSLVNSLLDLTRLQTGRIKFEPDKIEAHKIIETSINLISGTAYQKGINIFSDVNRDISVFVDKDLIGQVFNNLLSNAIKFSFEGGEIRISTSPSDSFRFIEFSVKDNGTGIKEEYLNQLFNIESKFTLEGTKGEKGSGLGLSLVKEIIEKHGGKTWVESEYKKGSDFRFTLPIASADILLVDDSTTDKLLYSKILMNITQDYNVETASSGKEALEKIRTVPPALIITDHQMPEMNGYEFIVELLKSDLKVKPPVIVLSSDINRSAVQDYEQLGIEFVFQKPVNLSIFKQAVEKSLKKGLIS